MRAVNLIPAESRVGASRAGGGAYVLLGVLAVLLAGVAVHVLTSNAIAQRRAELASLQVQVGAAQAQAEAQRPYRDFAALAQARVTTVRQLGAARFDWERALAGISRVVPGNVWLTSLLGTVTTGVSVEGGSAGNTSSLRSALPNPAIEMSGCTTGHDAVARLISRLRLLDGVARVALADSSKSDGGSGCANGHEGFPQFDVVVFFDPIPSVPPPPGTAPVAATTSAVPGQPATPAPAGTTPPQSTPPSGTTTGGSPAP